MATKIAIDGPGGAGKSTVARALAQRLRATYIDTGAMYRTVALFALRAGVDPKDEAGVSALLGGVALQVRFIEGEGQRIYLNGEDVTGLIRTPEVSMGASDVSAHGAVREEMVRFQRQIAEGQDVVMDGRDIGTHVFPDAEFKFYLTASPEVRARRRFLELQAKGGGAAVSYEECLRELKRRDENDQTRALSPLRPAEDAMIVDTDGYTAEEVADMLVEKVRQGSRREGEAPT